MPKWRELKRFCERDDWELYKTTDHFYFRKELDDGTFLYTKVSNSSSEIGSKMWKKILTGQLRVSQAYFNSKL